MPVLAVFLLRGSGFNTRGLARARQPSPSAPQPQSGASAAAAGEGRMAGGAGWGGHRVEFVVASQNAPSKKTGSGKAAMNEPFRDKAEINDNGQCSKCDEEEKIRRTWNHHVRTC